MKKIFSIFLILIVSYILIIFKLPNLATYIWESLWIEGFNEFVIVVWEKYNQVVTDLPTQEEVLETYNSTVSWAIEIKDTIVDWLETTKSYVDNIRLTLSWADETIDDISTTISELKENYDDTVEIIWDTMEDINNLKENVEIIADWLSSTWELTETWEVETLSWELDSLTNTWELE